MVWLCFCCIFVFVTFLAGEPQRSLVLQKMLRHEHVRACTVVRFIYCVVVIGAFTNEERVGVERQRVFAQRAMR